MREYVAQSTRQFWRTWRGFYGETPPLGFLLRQRYPDRWFRAHMLPESRRDPEDAADWQELLLRYRRLAAEVLAEGESCWLVHAYSYGIERSDRRRHAVRGHEQLKELGEHIEGTAWGDDPWRFYGAREGWDFGVRGQLWWDIADGRDGCALVVSTATGAVFAPYDGGIDLFVTVPESVAGLRLKYREWLSSEPSGL